LAVIALLDSLAFANSWLLVALAGLPVIWWLLRVTPPAHRRLVLPTVEIGFGLRPPEETPARTPLWLIILRTLIAILLILGLARPILNPVTQPEGSGPILLVVDNGWTAARNWTARHLLLEDLLGEAARDNRPVAVLASAPMLGEAVGAPPSLMSADEARRTLGGLQPMPWPGDRAALTARLEALRFDEAASVVWLSDGLASADDLALAQQLSEFGQLQVYHDLPENLPRLLLPPASDRFSLTLRAQRPLAGTPDRLMVEARDDEGRLITRQALTFAADKTTSEAALELPIELRNRISRLAVEGEASAGTVLFLDERWRRRPVGLIAGGSRQEVQPLLSDLYYLERALDPFTEVSRGDIAELLARDLAVIVLADVGSLAGEDLERLTAWVEAGGLLLRFAGPRLAESSDTLLPVRLRRGGRTLGGALTWDTPAQLADFPETGPLAGLTVPDEVTITRQVLAEPTLELPEKTWARLSDGTPLITADRRGDGWLVLAHTTANADWSSLPLSGLFVDVLRRIVAVSQGVSGSAAGTALPPIQTLDGFGRLGAPPPNVLDLDAASLDAGAVGPRHPPGIYGADSIRRAHNLAAAKPELDPLGELPSDIEILTYQASGARDLQPWLLGAALALFLIDWLIGLALRGLLGGARRRTALGALALAGGLLAVQGSAAASDDAKALAATLETRLAYVLTGDARVDGTSRAGLIGLSRMLARRTAVEPADPLPVRLGDDELAFYPLLYWPMTESQSDLDAAAVRALNDYMRHGGTVLIDLREPQLRNELFGQSSRGTEALRRLTRGIEVPALTPVPPDHVLTKSFYLMQTFPGRLSGGALWVEATDDSSRDGVATMLIGANDWASAWAISEGGQPLHAVVPGGERQREMAFRFGINLVMYALTGNYKADQVHVPFILERLGQ
jgi:hypothetical protein